VTDVVGEKPGATPLVLDIDAHRADKPESHARSTSPWRGAGQRPGNELKALHQRTRQPSPSEQTMSRHCRLQAQAQTPCPNCCPRSHPGIPRRISRLTTRCHRKRCEVLLLSLGHPLQPMPSGDGRNYPGPSHFPTSTSGGLFPDAWISSSNTYIPLHPWFMNPACAMAWHTSFRVPHPT
jgi:hypothetical protein